MVGGCPFAPFFLPLLRKRKKEATAINAATTKPAMTTAMVVTGRAAITVSINSSLIWFTPLIVGTA
jgi:hypothetical protein